MEIDRKLKVRKFYEQEYLKFFQKDGYDSLMYEFKRDNIISTYGFDPRSYGDLFPELYNSENLDEEERLFLEEQLSHHISYRESPSTLSLSIREKLVVPDSLLQACDRISWYLKQSYGQLTVIKVPVDGIDTFAICIQGYVDDGWDNSCKLIEIWDSSGNFIGSASPAAEDDMSRAVFHWNDRIIRGSDFANPAPEW